MSGTMRRKHRRANYSVFADEDTSRDLRIFVSSLVIGIMVGVFGLYFFGMRPYARDVSLLRAELAQLSTRTPQNCRNTNQVEELESRLSSCTASLNRLRQATAQVAQATETEQPPLPKPPPGRAPLPAVVEAPVMPVPEATPAEPVATPVEPVPPAPVPEATPAQDDTKNWPRSWPPVPRRHPPRPEGDAAQATETVVPEAVPAAPGEAPATALTSPHNVTLDVGQEEDMSGYRVRLIGVAQRSNGRYCLVGGSGIVSQRIASGTSKTVSWNGRNVVIGATVKDRDTCQIVLRPR